MGAGNAKTRCNHMYENYTLVVKKLFNVQLVFNNPNLVACTITMQFLTKSNVIDHICKYDAYKLSYMKHIQNYAAITKQLVYFLT